MNRHSFGTPSVGDTGFTAKYFWNAQSLKHETYRRTKGILRPQGSIGLKAKIFGLGFSTGLIATGLNLGLVSSWPRSPVFLMTYSPNP